MINTSIHGVLDVILKHRRIPSCHGEDFNTTKVVINTVYGELEIDLFHEERQSKLAIRFEDEG